MPIPFSRSMRSLNSDGFRFPVLGLLLSSIILGAWGTWFCLSRVSLFEITETARLEAGQSVHPIASQVFGRVITTQIALGKEVKRGDLLVELDTTEQRLQIVEERTRVTAINHQLAALRDELTAAQRAAAETHYRAPVALDEARAKYEESMAVARAGAEEAKRMTTLHAEGLVSEMETIRSQAEAKKRQAAATALSLAIKVQDKDQQVKENDRQSQQESLKRELAVLEGEILTRTATIERLQQTVEQRRICAPTTGRIGEVAELRIGAVVREGDKLGAIVPAGELRVVAEYPPPAVMGRIRVGQPAFLRLQGFPWTEYGKVAATVASVGNEPRAGKVRVELTIDPNPSSRIPLQHGLPGAIEILVDRVSPATLVLRNAGSLLQQNTP